MPNTIVLTRSEIQRLKNIARLALLNKVDEILETEDIWSVINELHELRKIYDYAKALVPFEETSSLIAPEPVEIEQPPTPLPDSDVDIQF